MTRGHVVLVGTLALVVLVTWAAIARLVAPTSAGADSTSSPTPSGALEIGSPITAPPSVAAPTAAVAGTPSEPNAPTSAPNAPTEAPTAAPNAPTDAPDPTGDPRILYAEFLLRLDEDRAEVADLNDTLLAAADGGDQAAVRSTAVDILQFADRERVWLLAHSPADCYATAHDAAGTMLEAYADVAERAIDWADAKRGLEALDALAEVLEAGADARAALADLGRGVEAATCLA